MMQISGVSTFVLCVVMFVHVARAELAQATQFTDVPNAEWAQILTVARDKWEALRQPPTFWRASLNQSTTYVTDGKPRIANTSYFVNCSEHCGLATTTELTHTKVVAWNRDYAFELSRKALPAESPYKIRYVGTVDGIRQQVSGKNSLAVRVFYADATLLVQSKGFSIHKMTQSDDQRFVSILFSSDYELPNGTEEVVKDGSFTLDMTLSAAVTEFSIRTKAKSGVDWQYDGKNEYSSRRGIPYPQSTSRTTGFVGREPHIFASTEYTDVRPADPDEADCRLSAFGFPEPGFSGREATTNWTLLIVLGNIAIGIIAFIIWRKSRQRAA